MSDAVYIRIAENIDKHAGGAPKAADGNFSPAFIDYLKLLYTPEEAILIQYLEIPDEILPSTLDPKCYMTAGQVASLSGLPIQKVKQILDAVSERGAIAGLGNILKGAPTETLSRLLKVTKTFLQGYGLKGTLKVLINILKRNLKDTIQFKEFNPNGLGISMYALPYMPLLVNVHHFHPEIREDDLKAAQLYQEFFIKDGFYKHYEGSDKGTPVMKVVPVERTIKPGHRILDTEEAHKVIDGSTSATLTPCPCRTRTEKLGIRECHDRNPVGSCIMLGFSALSTEASSLGIPVTKSQAKEYLDQMQDYGLVAATDNWEYSPHAIICLCCECCCSQVRGRTKWDNPISPRPSNFIPESDQNCVACGMCVKRCFFGAISIDVEVKKVIVDTEKCIGCGVCTITCKKQALRLIRLERAELIPTSRALYDRIALENQKLP